MQLTTLRIEDDKDIARLRLVGQTLARGAGFAKFAETRVVTALLELGRNIVQHAGGGRISLSLTERRGTIYLSAEAVDQGPGIRDLQGYLDGFVVHEGLGLGIGLRGVHRIADRFDVQTGAEGTRITAGFATAIPPDDHKTRAAEATDRLVTLEKADPAAMLAQQNRELLDALAERDLLMREVHHRTKNNLALVLGLMRLSRTGAQSEETKSVLRDLELRVSAIAKAHDELQRAASADSVPLMPLLRNVCQQANTAFSTPDLNLDIQICGDEISLRGSAATDMALATGELITNSCKHAFAGRSRGSIRVTVRHGEENVTLTVRDDGVGLIEGAERPERSGSLGWQMIRNMVEKHNGSIRTSVNDGFCVELVFPPDAFHLRP